MRKYILTESLKGKAWKTPKEIELEKKLEIAVKALKFYANRKTWGCCYRNQCAYVDGYIAQQALKEIKE